MTMFETFRKTVERSSRRIFCAAGLAVLSVIPTGTRILADDSPLFHFVRHQASQGQSASDPSSDSSSSASQTQKVSDYPDTGAPVVGGVIVQDGPADYFPMEGHGDYYPGDFGFGCPASWIVRADVLYLHRGGDLNSSYSGSFTIPKFDYEGGGRVAVARRYDCLIGWELVYTAPFEWVEQGAAAAAGGGINTVLGAAGINLSAFNNAVAQQETYISRFQTAEFVEKWWGWNVISTSVGAKYVNLEEDLAFNSLNNVAEVGRLTSSTNNHLIGGQVGIDLVYPIGRFSTTTKLRGSMYANFMDSTVVVQNAGVTQVANFDEKVDFASLIEFGYFVTFYVTPHVEIHCGYEGSWLYGLALAPGQITNPLSAGTGVETDRDGDIFFHNAVAGIEVTW